MLLFRARNLILAFAMTVMVVTGLHADVPALLDTAVQKLVADEDHWAYTQITRRADNEKEKGETVEQYDPSLPEDQQWKLIKFEGHAPTESEMRSWQKKKEKRRKRMGERSLGDLLDLENARLSSDDAVAATFEVPLQKDASNRYPPEKFIVYIRVLKKEQALDHVSLQSRGSFRIAGVAKVEEVGAEVTFKSIDEKFSPQPATLSGSGSGRVLHFIKMGKTAEITWTDHRRVKPYKDRYDVKIGDVKALDF
jgi:hypothetical protein